MARVNLSIPHSGGMLRTLEPAPLFGCIPLHSTTRCDRLHAALDRRAVRATEHL